ncbi:MAG: metallopeptidase family protein [Thermoleophilia bacterium]|nr:metallopeptidase family protein [Thermoleophilia bacterium]
MDSRRFEQLVDEALEGLPPEFAERLDNIALIVADVATPEQLAKVSVRNPNNLLGLYEGVPLTDRPRAYAGALPDRISIFRLPIQSMSRTDDEIKAQVLKTVMHELGHYFGMSEEQLHDV